MIPDIIATVVLNSDEVLRKSLSISEESLQELKEFMSDKADF
jgi:hypothetical protein